ncbi:MAG: GrpB family protein [Patescibacteria group bacterium]
MLTENQKKYLETIPESKIVEIKPWDPKTKEVAQRLIDAIKNADPELGIIYTGASALCVSGVNDLDFTVTCPRIDFDKHLPGLIKILGNPQKIGKENVRWEGIQKEGFIVDVHMTDPNSPSLKEHARLFELLKNNQELLAEYETLKVESNGVSYREYQCRKYEFYNRILGINQK